MFSIRTARFFFALLALLLTAPAAQAARPASALRHQVARQGLFCRLLHPGASHAWQRDQPVERPSWHRVHRVVQAGERVNRYVWHRATRSSATRRALRSAQGW